MGESSFNIAGSVDLKIMSGCKIKRLQLGMCEKAKMVFGEKTLLCDGGNWKVENRLKFEVGGLARAMGFYYVPYSDWGWRDYRSK